MKLRKPFTYLLAGSLLFSNVNFALAETLNNSKPSKPVITKQLDGRKAFDKSKLQSKADFKVSDKVRVIVEVDGETPIEYATKNKKLFKELPEKTKQDLAAKVEKQQQNVKKSLATKGIKVKYKGNFSTVFNGFSGEVTYGDIAKIENTAGVKNVYLSNEYNRPEVQPNMDKSHQFIQSYQTWGDAKYKGEGQVVAVIDTGVDPSHKDFVLSEGVEGDLEESEVKELVEEAGLKGKYFTEKVPYGFNYYDMNDTILDLGPGASMHGMHVAGTVAANGDVENGGLQGVAPESQVLAMKVFSNDPLYPSTWSDVYLAAIDDAIKLGADVLNMSLGSTASFYEPESVEDLAITRAVDNGVLAAVSAGNSGHVGYGWDNPNYENPDIGVVGAPGLNPDTLQVAASGNEGYLYETKLTVDESGFSAVGFGRDSWEDLADKEIVSLEGKLGHPGDYAGFDVEGKVVLVQRGALSFYDKTQNAAAAGAAGIIVYDSNAGAPFYKDQGGWDVPFTMISHADGNALRAVVEDQNLKTLGTEQLNKNQDPEMGRMTDFTSWGTTPSLEMKPEITAPGGNILSTLQNDSYGLMSGTSMAAPHVAGGSALIQQYLKTDERFKDLEASEYTRLAKILLMNSAKVIEDLNGQPFSPRRQGAGMMQTFAAVDTPVFVVNKNTGEAKVELKDFKAKSQSFTLTATNVSDKEVTYNVNTRLLTDTYQEVEGAPDQNALIAGDIQGAKVVAPKTVTVPAGESVDFTVSFDLTGAKIPGIDKDGKATSKDLVEDIFVEGFVQFTDANGAEAKLNVPFLGFFGEWDRPDILDGFRVNDEVKYFDYGVDDVLVDNEEYFNSPVPEKGYYALSPNGDGMLDNMNPFLGVLRNAKEVQYNILDEKDSLLRRVFMQNNVRKTYINGGQNPGYTYDSNAIWDGTVKSEKVEDGLYYYEVKSVVDYAGADWQSKKIPVYVDTTAPAVAVTFDEKTGELKWEAKDEGVGVASYVVVANGEVVQELGAEVTSHTFDNLPEGTLLQVHAVDHAYNVGYDEVANGDTESPLLLVDSPEPYGAYNTKEVPVEGYVLENVKVAKVTINGEPANVSYDEEEEAYYFNGVAKFDKDGKYDVIITATDVSGNEYSISRKVFVDSTKPTVTTDAPAFVDNSVGEVKVNVEMKDNFDYFSLYVDDNHLYDQSIENPVSVVNEGTRTVAVPLSLKEGDNVFTVKVTDIAGNETVEEVKIHRNTDASRVNRLAGDGRYKTAVEVSKKGWGSGAETVVLARGDNYADALAGVPLAKKFNAPLLLTEPNKFTQQASDEINRLGAKTVYILGGTGAVNEATEKALRDKGIKVERVSGSDRYDTAAKIAKHVAPEGVEEVVVVNGNDFPDALSVASFAAAKGMPILLTQADSLPGVTAKTIRDLGASKSLIVGGTSVVSNGVKVDLPYGYRLGGQNRYDTAAKVAEYFHKDSNHYYLATGKGFADALSGAALAAKDGTGVLLTDENLSAETEKFINGKNLDKVTVLGGSGVVSDSIVAKLKNLLK
ncbi:cell wall-binding repeat-containing protein [Mesobacillus selenatarsenatis]|uniref:Putative cell wall-binding domain n=1 Tax=Mesobacillus selenatarsenatis (strain DSM 18680 / JCM 14380 / FERM P-15431 / SF-1) TaxID=1321606 RepID=A0A0A8WWN7_MESS1|nr:cell wall-binding repeat-containing protein [Mesobacillus selenatarsenatis]GAM12028.1 putative cell wall-binding domain [Mesobacillus selenatarsenatis SF-1]